MSTKHKKLNLLGFSFLEFLIIVAIIGTLTAIAIPAYGEYVTRTKTNKMLKDVKDLKSAVSDYRVINGKFLSASSPEEIKEIYGLDDPTSESTVIDKAEVISKGINKVLITIIGTGTNLSMKPGQSLELNFSGTWSKEDGIIWKCSAKGQVKYAPSICRDKKRKPKSKPKKK